MINITLQQAHKRFKTVSERLQDELYSVQTAEIVRSVCEENHLAGEKIGDVADATGLVFLGFIHPEDLAREITERIQIPKQVAEQIAGSLNTKLFNKMRSELDTIYAPVPPPLGPEDFEEGLEEAEGKPKPVAAPTPQAATSLKSQEEKGPIDLIKLFGSTPLAASGAIDAGIKPVAPASPKPTPVSPPVAPQTPAAIAAGIKTAPAVPQAAIGGFPSKPFAPPAIQPTALPAKPEDKKNSSVPLSEFEKLGLGKMTKPQHPAMPQAAVKESEPAPVVLFKEQERKIGERTSGFKIDASIPKFSDIKQTSPPPPKAILEFGTDSKASSLVSVPKLAANEKKPENSAATRIVNYTSFRTPVGGDGKPTPQAKPPLAAAGREVKEVTSAPMPQKPPVVPMPPKTAAPSAFPPAGIPKPFNLGSFITPIENKQIKQPVLPPQPAPQPQTPQPPRPRIEPPPIRKPETPNT